MNFINQSVEVLEQPEGVQGIYDIIAKCASTCYQSVPKEGDLAKSFVEKLIANEHGAMLEFGTVYLKVPDSKTSKTPREYKELEDIERFYHNNPYSKINVSDGYAITTNFRVIVENNRYNDLKYICSPTEHHELRKCVRLITSIGVAREFTRHRTMSFAQESTRYCNYSKDKFGNELTCIMPEKDNWGVNTYYEYINTLDAIEECYVKATQEGTKPEIAREILPLSLKTELCICGFVTDWKKLFKLRCKENAHPYMRKIATMIKDKLL